MASESLLSCISSFLRVLRNQWHSVSGHSTETALLKVVNDIVTSACDQQTTILLSLDISAAFDSISHRILLDRLHHDFGIRGTALSWL